MGEYRLKIHMETKGLSLTVGFLVSLGVAQAFAATGVSTAIASLPGDNETGAEGIAGLLTQQSQNSSCPTK